MLFLPDIYGIIVCIYHIISIAWWFNQPTSATFPKIGTTPKWNLPPEPLWEDT